MKLAHAISSREPYPHTEGQAMAEVSVKVGNLEFIAAITEGSVKTWA